MNYPTDETHPNGLADLESLVAQSHAVLHARMRSAEACRPTRGRPREALSATDPFLASTSRHLAAVNAVLAPAARRHLDHGHRRVHELTQQSRRLELALAQLKAKLYGSAGVVRRPWISVWEETERELAATRALEFSLVTDLRDALTPVQQSQLAERLHRSERRAPTRPHPFLPHRGASGRLARQVARRVDRFWDTAEGRMVPEPVRPHRTHTSRMVQYLLADPHLPD